jgi:creatinine amidohydrolase
MVSVGQLSSVAWTAQTRTEIQKTGETQGSVVVIPVGSIEQHGYHLPVATDTLLADAVAHQGAERVADDIPVIVTPPRLRWITGSTVSVSSTATVGTHPSSTTPSASSARTTLIVKSLA